MRRVIRSVVILIGGDGRGHRCVRRGRTPPARRTNGRGCRPLRVRSRGHSSVGPRERRWPLQPPAGHRDRPVRARSRRCTRHRRYGAPTRESGDRRRRQSSEGGAHPPNSGRDPRDPCPPSSDTGGRLVWDVRADGSADTRRAWGQDYRRPMDQLDGAPLRGGEGGTGPFFSPDGEWVGLAVPPDSGTTVRKVSIHGGPPVTLTESARPLRGASWGTDNQIIFGTFDSGLFRVSGDGGELEVLTTPESERGETSHTYPFIIPGNHPRQSRPNARGRGAEGAAGASSACPWTFALAETRRCIIRVTPSI